MPLHLSPTAKPALIGAGIHIQCKDNLAFMRTLVPGSMHLVLTSPPYNTGKVYEKETIPLDGYIAGQAALVEEAVRLLHPQGSLCWQVGNHIGSGEVFPLDILLYNLFKSHGLKLRNRIVWHFGQGLHCRKRFSGRYETILWFTRSDNYLFNLDAVRIPSRYLEKKYFKGPRRGQVSGHPLGKNLSDIWAIPNVKANHVEKTIHPCQFPVALAERLILALTRQGDNVLDPCLGAGSTAIAAVKQGRNVYGCDSIPEYVDISLDRLDRLLAQTLPLRPLNKPVYNPVPFRRKSQGKHV